MKDFTIGWQGVSHTNEITIWFILMGKNSTKIDHTQWLPQKP
jgi:hypothetical protein